MNRVRSPITAFSLLLFFVVAAPFVAFSQVSPAPAPSPSGSILSTPGPVSLPVTKVVLFSAGVGYFEHRGLVDGDVGMSLPFAADSINDALKSLVVRNGSGGQGSPSVNYPTQESLDRALKSFRVDLSGSPDIAGILSRLRGAEVSVDTPETISGRIVGIEQRVTKIPEVEAPYLMLLTSGGLRAMPLESVLAIRFADRQIAEDFDRALSLILSAQDVGRKNLELSLPGTGRREVAIGYVVPAPIWKVSYRLDLSGAKPYFQGWAVVDNPTEQDWKNVSLSLVSGRPVSFIQDLYSPLYVDRPVIPLAIAGSAKPRSFESGFEESGPGSSAEYAAEVRPAPAPEMAMAAASRDKSYSAKAAAPEPSLSAFGSSSGGRNFETAQARAAGDQFEFTVSRPVTLERRRSAMLPLLEGELEVEKLSIYSPGTGGDAVRPMLGARIVNSSGMKLPAGPITVFDGSVYAGDALLDFLPENEKRLIVFGEDLSVTASAGISSAQETTAVKIIKGVMTFSRRVTWTRTYNLRNTAASAKKLMIEHPVMQGAELTEPSAFDEKTSGVYRFSVNLPAGAETKFIVRERMPGQDRVVLSSLGSEAFLSYSSSKEIPAAARDALKKAVDLRRKVDDAKKLQSDLQSRKAELSSEQERYRKNIESVGRDSSQGQQYLKKLLDAETEIDGLNSKIADSRKAAQEAQTAYDSYLAGLTVE